MFLYNTKWMREQQAALVSVLISVRLTKSERDNLSLYSD